MSTDFTAIDVVFGIIVIFATLRAGLRGFVKEALSVASLALGVVVAVLFSGTVAGYLDEWLGVSVWNQIIAFLGIFVVLYVLIKLFENALHRMIERVHLQSLDHAMGLLLGVVEGVVVVFLLILLIQIQPVADPERLLRGSFFARALLPFLPYVAEMLVRR
ncbi:MAG: CvpA family protein [Spirochaetota bacterium]